MKNWLPFLLSMLCADVALADPPAEPARSTQRALALLQRELLQPLQEAESHRSRFSRAVRPAEARRVRLLDSSLQTDVHGKHFVRFAVDAHYGPKQAGRWRQGVYTGCAYPDQNQVFVLLGTDYMRASVMLHGGEDHVRGACRAADADRA